MSWDKSPPQELVSSSDYRSLSQPGLSPGAPPCLASEWGCDVITSRGGLGPSHFKDGKTEALSTPGTEGAVLGGGARVEGGVLAASSEEKRTMTFEHPLTPQALSGCSCDTRLFRYLSVLGGLWGTVPSSRGPQHWH